MGLAFQKVDTGIVKAAIRADEFTPVIWPDAQTESQSSPDGQQIQGQVLNLHNPIQLPEAPANVPGVWQEFTDSMRKVKNAMLERVS